MPALFLYALPLILILVSHITSLVYEVFVNPSLFGIPGPFLARFTRLWYFYRVWKGDFETVNIALHGQYGPIVRISPGHYSISNHSDVQTVYSAGTRFTKSAWYDAFKDPSPHEWSVFTDRNNKRHNETRRKFTSLYSMSSVLHYEEFVDKCANLFTERLSQFAHSGELIDFHHWLQCYAFDVIGEITFGQRFGFLDEGKDIMGALSTVRKLLTYSALIGIYPQWHPRLYKILGRFTSSGPGSRTFIIGFVVDKLRLLNEMRSQSSDQPSRTKASKAQDFMERMAMARDQDPEKINDYHLLMMGVSNVIAGSDTTAMGLSSIMYHLLRNPNAFSRLRQEIDDFTMDQQCSTQITFRESQKMPYLQAVVKEALRMHSATGLPLWREVPVGGAEINGYSLPEGAVVGINTWVAHYNEEVFPNPKSFLPERWLQAESNPSKLRAMNEIYMPFGLGSRTCLGKHISILEISRLVPQLIRDFDFVLENQTWTTENLWFVKPTDFRVKISLRNKEI